MDKSLVIFLTFLQFLSAIKGNAATGDAKKVVCYFAGLTAPQRNNLRPEDIDATVCTHIVFLHGGINTDHGVFEVKPIFDAHQTGIASYVERLVRLKEVNPNLKLLLFISTEHMPWVLEDADRRTKIIKSAITLLNRTRFDGLDFSTVFGDDPIEGMSEFLCEMHAAFSKYSYIISSTVSPILEPTSEEIEDMSRCCSFISVQTIGNWMTTANNTKLLAPINQTRKIINSYIKKGYQANKLLILIPTFGMIFTLSDPKQTGLGANVSGPGAESSQITDGYTIFYRELSTRLNDATEGWTIIRDEESNSPYAYSKAGKWLSYEDPVSVEVKARYVLEKDLGGVFIFTFDTDDFEGLPGKTFPITRAASDAFKERERV